MSGATATPVAGAATTPTTPVVAPTAARGGVVVETFIDPDKAVKDVEVNSLDLGAELDRQPGLVYYYIAMQAKAERQLSTLKLRQSATEATRAGSIRADTLAAGDKITEAALTAKVSIDPAVIRIAGQVIQAKEVERTIMAVVEALRNKKDVLVSKVHMARDEMKARLDVSTQTAADGAAYVRDRDARTKERLANNAAA